MPVQTSKASNIDPGYNPQRTADLYALTSDGYIIAQDILCQYEYVQAQVCPHCHQPKLEIVANINRAFQGLNELVALCDHCNQRSSFIFDISNDVYQNWWASRMGDAYLRTFEGKGRKADPKKRQNKKKAK